MRRGKPTIVITNDQVWAIRATIRVLNNDGNLLDAVCMAAVAALSHFRRPDVSVVDDEVIVVSSKTACDGAATHMTILSLQHPVSERTPLPLSVHYIPICTTFGLFRGMNTTLLDPTQTESRVQSGELTICLNNHREICTISKAGGVPVELNTLLRCGKIAAEKTSEVAEMIRKAVADDVKLKLDSAKRSESMHSGGDRNRPMG